MNQLPTRPAMMIRLHALPAPAWLASRLFPQLFPQFFPLLAALLALFLATHAPAARAELGASGASIEADRIHMKAVAPARQSSSPSGGYTMHETVLPNGLLVRQYLSAQDKVFAVTWSGPYLPDLRQLLGPYFDLMNERRAKQAHTGHSSLIQHEADLVVESGGHPRSFAGRAYLPAAIPAGLDLQQIR